MSLALSRPTTIHKALEFCGGVANVSDRPLYQVLPRFRKRSKRLDAIGNNVPLQWTLVQDRSGRLAKF